MAVNVTCVNHEHEHGEKTVWLHCDLQSSSLVVFGDIRCAAYTFPNSVT